MVPGGVTGDGEPQGSKGDQGVAGSKGDCGSPEPKGSGKITDLCTWMPHTVLKNLQENEEDGCFLIVDLSKDIKRKGIGDITSNGYREVKNISTSKLNGHLKV